ncbi:DUF4038 domain-containing protein [Stieleria sp. TO1_6]|uniref:DUF5060 domain-containing protein n=1 Tax=Stieleria tagensis TaxID=2956795 RepID=UPI00209B6139|nr:DUF5060 domain-containing protein [Stieleria tagensis]MCO8120979.1 DUF4038 domain-containing protein [Stieleria tagensis]
MIRVHLQFTFLLILGLLCVQANAIETVDHQQDKALSAYQYDVIDIRFQIEPASSEPTDVEFSATFESDSGQSLTVAGFYNGESEYRIRFTPPAVGNWRYATRSTTADLDGNVGKLSVHPARVGRKGGVVVDPDNPRNFEYENGEQYYPIAFECDWLFALDAENDSDIPVTRQFVDTLAENGFNQVVMNVFAYDVNWKKDNRLRPEFDYGRPSVFPFGGNNENPDYQKLNVDYFKRLDRVIDYLDQKGIVAHLMVYVWNKGVAWPEAKSEADNRYFDFVVRRYQAYPNLVWDISKEALGYGHTDVNYITDRIERLRRADVFDRLVTVHDYSYCRRFSQNVDFVSVQLWSSELYSVMRNVCEAIAGKPILNIEHGGYERGPYEVFNGNYTSPEVCLQRAYQCVFAGTYPTHYWQGAAWNVIVANIDALPQQDRPRLEYYRHMQSFVDRFKLGDLIAGDKKSNAGFCLHNGNDLYVYYVPKECDYFGLRLPKDRGNRMTTTWFDPLTGNFDEPVHQKITQWPTVKTPNGDGFHLLVVNVHPE